MSFTSEHMGVARGLVVLAVGSLIGCTVEVDNPPLGDSSASQTMSASGSDDNGPGDGSTSDVPDDSTGDPTNDTSDPTSDPDSSTGGAPAGCGNGQLDEGEDCDGDLFAVTCEDYGFDGGELTCGPNCNVGTAGCFGCGNGVLEAGEECDGNDLGGETCQSLGDYVGGQLACTNDCEYSLDGCIDPHCGDGILNLDEACDGNDFGGKTCQTEGGFNQGTLSCTMDCTTIDTSGCFSCQEAIFGDCSVLPCCGNAICLPDANVCFGM
jgi:hypothetical protein